MNIAFFGLPLAALLLARDGHCLTTCVLSPVVAPGGRRLRRVVGDELVLDVRGLAQDVVGQEVKRRLDARPPDLLVSWYWTRRLPKEWLERPPLGAVGVHPSLLPRHRGPDPFFWAIDAGDTHSGVSVHLLEEAYDEGAVLAQHSIEIGARNAWQLARALDRPGLLLLRCIVGALSEGLPLERQQQDSTLSTWAPRPSGRELTVDWQWDTERVLRRVRALCPFPGLALSIRGLDMDVTQAEPTAEFPLVLRPGEAGILTNPPRLVIRTGDGAISILRATVELTAGQPKELDATQIAQAIAVRDADPP